MGGMSLNTGYGARMEAKGFIEEVFIHEGAHASLDGYHVNVGLFSMVSIVVCESGKIYSSMIIKFFYNIDRLANGYVHKTMTGNSSLPTLVIIQGEKMSLKVLLHGLQ